MEKRLIGGQKLREMGSSRYTDDLDYMIYDESDSRLFVKEESGDLINAANHPFYSEIWKKGISEQTMLEMAAFTFVQHCMNGYWDKADTKEFDIKFLVRLIGQDAKVEIVRKYITIGQEEEVNRIIGSVKF